MDFVLRNGDCTRPAKVDMLVPVMENVKRYGTDADSIACGR